jgi:DNA ligase-1
VQLSEIAAASLAVAATRSRKAKTALLAAVITKLTGDEVAVGVSYLSGRLPQGKLGVGFAAIRDVDRQPAIDPTLRLAEGDAILREIEATRGAGSRARRGELLDQLMGSATEDERQLLFGLLGGGLRQGALDGVMADAIATAYDVPRAAVRRAAMLSGKLAAVAQGLATEGADVLSRFGLEVGTAVQPMLASTAESAAAAVAEFEVACVEWKVDGARLQIHREGDSIEVFTRSLRRVTSQVGDIVEVARSIDSGSYILDAEAISLRPDGAPEPFQVTMQRFGRHAETSQRLDLFVFDALRLDSAGRRGSAWLKVKPAHTLDLVVLAVEWGSGRRQGLLSNIHLGARHGDRFVMLGKTFKGMTDEMLAWQTERFLELETHREGHVVYVRPEQVVEVAIDGVQRSSRYPGGVALRFARVKGYRDDKRPDQVDTLETVRSHLAI